MLTEPVEVIYLNSCHHSQRWNSFILILAFSSLKYWPDTYAFTTCHSVSTLLIDMRKGLNWDLLQKQVDTYKFSFLTTFQQTIAKPHSQQNNTQCD